MVQRTQPRMAPIGIEPGDQFKHPWGVFDVLDKRGDYDDGDTREWLLQDEDTDEKVWVDFDFLLEVGLANLSKKQPTSE